MVIREQEARAQRRSPESHVNDEQIQKDGMAEADEQTDAWGVNVVLSGADKGADVDNGN